MLTSQGFSAWIECDGIKLPEFLIAEDKKKRSVSCWIPARPGHPFAVFWKDHGSKVDTCTYITLDGHVVPGRFLAGSGIGWRGGVRSSGSTERPFMFQDVDESGPESKFPPNREQGTIVLKIKKVKRGGSKPANTIMPLPPPSVGPGDLRVSYAEDRTTYLQNQYTWDVKDENNEPPPTFVTFVFRYRSQDFLVEQGIMPEDAEFPVSIPYPIPPPPTSPSPEREVSPSRIPERASVRRIVSAPVVPVQPSSHSRTLPSQRAVTLVPTDLTTAPESELTTANTSSEAFRQMAPQYTQDRRTGDQRRHLNWRAVPQDRPDAVPGEGVLAFNEPLREPDYNVGQPIIGLDSTLSTPEYAVRNNRPSTPTVPKLVLSRRTSLIFPVDVTAEISQSSSSRQPSISQLPRPYPPPPQPYPSHPPQENYPSQPYTGPPGNQHRQSYQPRQRPPLQRSSSSSYPSNHYPSHSRDTY